MKKDKEWLKKEINKVTSRIYGADFNTIKETDDLINQLDEPQKPVVPQFVADYIEQSKKDYDSINQVFAFIDDKEDKNLWHWLFPSMYEDKRANQEMFMRAWLDGYEVEKEKFYYIKLPTKTDFSYLNYDVDESVHFDNFKGTQFTEQEIKAIDERYWAFAEEVTE